MNGFLLDTSNDVYCIGYYGEQDIPFLAQLARSYTICDNYFVSILGPTFPNRLFLHSAQTDRLTDSIGFTSLPTIWDRLAAAGVSGNYYFNNVPFLTLWGLKYLGITKTYDDFKSAAKNGMLPAVSYVDPNFTTIDDGLGNDDHPHADIRRGDRFLHDTSILKLIEWRWGLAPLTPRDASSDNREPRHCTRFERAGQVFADAADTFCAVFPGAVLSDAVWRNFQR
jgi:phospholipase C